MKEQVLWQYVDQINEWYQSLHTGILGLAGYIYKPSPCLEMLRVVVGGNVTVFQDWRYMGNNRYAKIYSTLDHLLNSKVLENIVMMP